MKYLKINALCLALCAGAQLGHAQFFFCGDANGDTEVNIADVTYGLAYLFNGGPPPIDFQSADFDRQALYTIADVIGLAECLFVCDFPQQVDCANDPLESPVDPPPNNSYKIIYPNEVPANSSSFVMSIHLGQRLPVGQLEWDISGFTLPFELLLDGLPAQVDSIVFPESDQPLQDLTLFSNLHEPGKLVLGAWSLFSPPSSAGRFVEIHLTTPSSPSTAALDMQWTTLTPLLGPPEDSSLYPLVRGTASFETFVPTLVGSCCTIAGDANDDGRVNIADITYHIARIFAGGLPFPCRDAENANGDNAANIGDVTYLIARIFAAGSAPVCGSTGI